MNGGIDQQIQQKVDAYRGNPQALQQRYSQNQQLIDLLALQKLKSEKDAAARDMQMKMQQSPQTVKDQLEAEMLQRTKDDMVKQTGSLLAQRQQAQQKNLQRVAQAGLPAAMKSMPKMAGGGIVGFAGPQGSQVVGPNALVEEDDNELTRFYRLSRRSPQFLTPEQKEELFNLRKKYGTQRPEIDASTGATEVDQARRPEPVIQSSGPEPVYADIEPTPEPEPVPAPATEEPSGIAAVPGIVAPKIGTPTQGISEVQATQAAALDPTTQALLDQSKAKAGELMSRDPTTMRKEMEADAGALLGRERARETYADMERRLAELDARQMDPKKLQQEKLLGVLGAVGRGNKARTAVAFDEQRRQAERNRMLERMGIEREGLKTDIDIGKSQISSGLKGFEQAALGERAGLGAGVDIANKEKEVLSAQADRENEARIANQVRATELYKVEAQRLREDASFNFDTQKENASNRIKELEIEENRKLRTDLAKYNSAESLRRDISKLAIELDAARQKDHMADSEYRTLKQAVEDAESESERAKALAKLDRWEEERDVELAEQNAQKIAQLNAYRNRLRQLESTPSGISANDVTAINTVR